MITRRPAPGRCGSKTPVSSSSKIDVSSSSSSSLLASLLTSRPPARHDATAASMRTPTRRVAFRRPSSYAAEPRMLRIFEAQDPDYSARLRALCERSAETPVEIEAAARTIIADVRKRGDAAVRELTARFEKRDLAT